MLQDGVLTAEIGALLVAADIARREVQVFLQDTTWLYPRASRIKHKQLHRIFDERRASASNEASKIKGSCAELLGLYGMLRHFIECVATIAPEHDAAKQSFFAACDVVDAILAAKFCRLSPQRAAADLQTLTARFMELHKAAYGVRFIKPKHHWQMDVPPQIVRDGVVLDAFVVERGHLAVKAIAEHVRNTTTFEVRTRLYVCVLRCTCLLVVSP